MLDLEAMVPAQLARYRDRVYADDVGGGGDPDGEVGVAHGKVRGKGDGEGDGGVVVVVRPDGYVGCVVRLVEGSGTVDALDAYFAGFVPGVGLADGEKNGGTGMRGGARAQL